MSLFVANLGIDLDEIQYATTTFDLLKLMLTFFGISILKRRELWWRYFMEYTFNIVLCQDTCEPICYKLGMMLSTTKLCCLIPVWVTLMFARDDRLVGKARIYAVILL